VDEYQDSNGVQDAIYEALTQEKNNLFLVGDVKQSIYQFRLADPGIFLEKYNTFVPAEEAKENEGRKVLLSQNFRSSGAVLSCVNDVFRYCMSREVGGLVYGEGEALYEGIAHDPLPEPDVELCCVDVREDTYREEASYVASRIQKMLRSGSLVRGKEGVRPVQPEDIVILLRSPGSAGMHYQRALESLGIRCASGGGEDLLQTQEISVLVSLLQVIQNPLQDIPLVAVLSSPVFGFTADDLARIRCCNRKDSFFDALRADRTEQSYTFLATLQELRQFSRMHSLTELL
jgi:ATP-dependent helicase/nuclease subunit A